MKQFSIAIDGPAGAGKSTIAKLLAKNLGCIYIDTGAMYRAVGYYCIKNGIEYDQEASVKAHLDKIELTLQCLQEGQVILLNGENISSLIRTDEVAAAASKVATYGVVRKEMVRRQQEMAKTQSIVMDGRDIGTVVLPFATLKVFLTASVEVRAQRRFKEYNEKGLEISIEQLSEEIRIRDEQDSTREISPLKQAEDAILLDTTHLKIEEIVTFIKEALMQRL